MERKTKIWNLRGLTSLLTLAGFLVMSVTGLVLYVVPQGRIAYWTNWTFLGGTKTHWGDIHILSSLLFVVAGAAHVYFNWKPLMSYFRDRARGGVKLKKELALSVAATILVVISGVYKVPPLSYLLHLNEAIKAAWVVDKEYEPPFGHAELLSLRVFCKKTEISLSEALAELKRRGLKQVRADSTVEQIARTNRISPLDLFRMIKRFEAPPARARTAQAGARTAQAGARTAQTPPHPYTVQGVEERFAGTGLGNKSLSDIGQKVEIDVDKLLTRLRAKGIEGAAGESLKAMAMRNGLAPLELLKAALVEAHIPKKL